MASSRGEVTGAPLTTTGSRPMLEMNTCSRGRLTLGRVGYAGSHLGWRCIQTVGPPRTLAAMGRRPLACSTAATHRAGVLHIHLRMLARDLLVHDADVAAVVPAAGPSTGAQERSGGRTGAGPAAQQQQRQQAAQTHTGPSLMHLPMRMDFLSRGNSMSDAPSLPATGAAECGWRCRWRQRRRQDGGAADKRGGPR